MRRLIFTGITFMLASAAMAQYGQTPTPKVLEADCDELYHEFNAKGTERTVEARNVVNFRCELRGFTEVEAVAGQRIVFKDGFRAPEGTKLHARIVEKLSTTGKWEGAWTEAQHTGDMKVFPNPSQGEVFVALPETGEPSNVQVIDLVGNVVMSEQAVTGSLIRFDLTAMPKGVYFLRVSTPSQDKTTKLVLQ